MERTDLTLRGGRMTPIRADRNATCLSVCVCVCVCVCVFVCVCVCVRLLRVRVPHIFTLYCPSHPPVGAHRNQLWTCRRSTRVVLEICSSGCPPAHAWPCCQGTHSHGRQLRARGHLRYNTRWTIRSREEGCTRRNDGCRAKQRTVPYSRVSLGTINRHRLAGTQGIQSISCPWSWQCRRYQRRGGCKWDWARSLLELAEAHLKWRAENQAWCCCMSSYSGCR